VNRLEVFPLFSGSIWQELFPEFQFHIMVLSALARLRLLSVLFSTLSSLNPRRLEIIFNLELA